MQMDKAISIMSGLTGPDDDYKFCPVDLTYISAL